MTIELFSLEGRTAVVTGANKGLGQAIAIALARAGADVVSISRSPSPVTQAAVEAAGSRYVHVAADLASSGAGPSAIAAAIEALGAIDVLVNNAGTIRRADALAFTETDWDEVVDLNLKAAFFLAQAAARTMTGRGGKIINIASLLSFQGGVRVASYTASKSGLLGLTRLLANEWAPRGIQVNAIAPGYFATDNTAALRDDPVRAQEILGRIPAGRWGMPDDLAGAAVFLASRASDYVNGAVLPVDGGWLAR